jgi:hypothetical protein
VVPIDLDPKVEHPEDRKFKRADLIGYVQENRPRLVAAALTVLRAFVVAGWPAHGQPPKGSFEAWDQLVRSAIIWAGGADPLGLRSSPGADRPRRRAGSHRRGARRRLATRKRRRARRGNSNRTNRRCRTK